MNWAEIGLKRWNLTNYIKGNVAHQIFKTSNDGPNETLAKAFEIKETSVGYWIHKIVARIKWLF